jgi:hypothetical protein
MHIVELVSLVEDMNTLVAAGVPQEVLLRLCPVVCSCIVPRRMSSPVLLWPGVWSGFGCSYSLLPVVCFRPVCSSHLQRVSEKLSPWNRALYEFLPPLIRKQLLTEREIRGKLQLSQVSGARGGPLCDLCPVPLSTRPPPPRF